MIDLVTRLDEATAKRIKIWSHPKNRGSEVGHPCERFLVAARTHTKKMALHGIGLQRIFDEGKSQERAILRELEEAEVEVVEQQRPFDWDEFEISGHIDGQVKSEEGLVPLELKSCSPNSFRAVQKMVGLDFIRAKQSWLRKYPGQIYCYLMMIGKEAGIILFKNKTSNEKHQVNFTLDNEALDYTESILQKLTRVNAHVKAGTLPEVKQIDECKGCPFCSTLCFPGQDYGPGFSVMSDADLESKLERREELIEARAEYEDLDKEIKAAVQGKNLVVGHFIIESSERERIIYQMPDSVKAQYAEKKKYWVTKIERI